MQEKELEILVKRASSGDKRALEEVILEIKDYIYNLSLKMLLYPEDAKDATQEILIKVITHLSTFNFKSKFTTWVYRVATNYLLNQKSKKAKAFTMPFSDYANLIDTGQSEFVVYSSNEGELKLLEEEVKVSCTQGLLLCLNKMDRMVYILSELLEFSSVEGADILNITPENFRQKLSRSRKKIRNFLNNKCGLVNVNCACRCKKKIDFLINKEIIDPNRLKYADLSQRSIDLIHTIDEVDKTLAVYRSVPKFEAPKGIFENVKLMLSEV